MSATGGGAYSVTSKACKAMITTRMGMRRILKHKLSPSEYIKKAVETGVYRTYDEIEAVKKERLDSADDLRTIMKRFRQDIVRGNNIHDYPIEYLILEQHPPIPQQPHIAKKHLKAMEPEPNPVEKLTKKYLQRQHDEEQKNMSTTTKTRRRRRRKDGDIYDDFNSAPVTSEDYYRRLLGIPAHKQNQNAMNTSFAALQHKPPNVQKAYVAAVKQYELIRTENMSEEDALQKVEELLAEENVQERNVSHERTQKTQDFRNNVVGPNWRVHNLRESSDNKPKQEFQSQATTTTTAKEGAPLLSVPALSNAVATTTTEATADADKDIETTLETIFNANPATLEGMMRWSERLDAVPYREWTVGASTALDHWVARQLLGLSEETWLVLLHGQYDLDSEIISKGRDIVAVREALFPETVLEDRVEVEQQKQEEEDAAIMAARSEAEAEEEGIPSIDTLLDSLGGLKTPKGLPGDDDSKLTLSKEDDFRFVPDAVADADLDEKIYRLTNELQDWRRKKQETPYEYWNDIDKKRFDDWVKDYVDTVAPTSSSSEGGGRGRAAVDLESTREALLSAPPVNADESDEFWSQIQHEGQAEALLDAMVDDGPPPGASILQSAFWDLPRKEQLQRLMNLGSLRPLLDEYTKESDRLRFLQRHADTILMGVELEHLVSDPNGPIRATDLSPDVARQLRVRTNDRFRMELRPYKSVRDEHGDELSALEKSRSLFKAWNELKVGRALYEEKMYRSGRLGLRYSDPPDQQDPAGGQNKKK